MGTQPVGSRAVVASVSPMFTGLALLMVGGGLLGSLVGLRAEVAGFSTIVIGVVMAMYYVGFLIGSLSIPRRLATVGHIRVFTGLAALAAAASLTFPLLVSPMVWGGLRFIIGLSMAGLFVTVESWLNERASNDTRGRLLSIYMLVVTLGLGLGQLLLGVDDGSDATLFILVGILISLAVVPIALIRIPVPSKAVPIGFSLVALRRTAPLGVLAVAISGATGSAVLALGAVYAAKTGMDPGRVGVFMAASLVGGAVSQYPLGHLSDRFPRRRVILAVSVAAVVAAGSVAVFGPGDPWLFVIAAAYGALAFPMYSLAVSMINDVTPSHRLVAAAAGIVFIYGLGSVAGPLAVSLLMELLGSVGYFWGLGGFFVPLVVYALARIIFTVRPGQLPFISLPHRSSVAAAMLADLSEDEPV